MGNEILEALYPYPKEEGYTLETRGLLESPNQIYLAPYINVSQMRSGSTINIYSALRCRGPPKHANLKPGGAK
jgi:hypothetical protein